MNKKYQKNYKSLTEKQLLTKCRRGDTTAFDEIILRNQEYIYSWILSKEKNQHKAEDIFQRTLIKSWKAIKKFKGDSTYTTWANAIARNLFIDDYRKRQRSKEDYLEDVPEHKRPAASVDYDSNPLKIMKNSEKNLVVDQVFKGLSDAHQKILKLYYKDELTYQQISEKINCSIGTVMSRLFYAKKNALRLARCNKGIKEELYD